METRILRLKGGRRLAWCQVGDPAGVPVLHAHGGLSCRLEIAFADALCRKAGVRWIALDRPGMGGSDFEPGQSLLDRARDMRALADHIALERFAVSGWSAGGPYALACAALMPARASRAIVLAGMAPLRNVADVRALGMATDRFLFRLAPRWSRLAAAGLAGARWAPAGLLRHAVARMLAAGPDAAHLSPEAADEVAAALAESLRPGSRGMVEDYRLLASDWGFDPGALEAPVSIWHGERDELLPFEHAQRLAAEIPGVVLNRCPETGHFLPRRHLPAVFAEVATSVS